VDWHGGVHPTSHAHARNAKLLDQVGAPQAVQDGWDDLDRLRVGSVYGGKAPAAGNSNAARQHLAAIKAWAASAHP
jgi:hypothetical protein